MALGSIGGVVNFDDTLEGGREDSKDGDGEEVGEKDVLHADHLLTDVSANQLDESAGNEAAFGDWGVHFEFLGWSEFL